MGKSIPSTTTGLKNFARIISSDRMSPPKHAKPTSNHRVSVSIPQSTAQPTTKVARHDPAQKGPKSVEGKAGSQTRFPLSMVVSDCVKRWFQDTLKEAKAGDSPMQILVGQMYNSGYGVRKDLVKGRNWITAASKGRSSAWKVSNKQPGYNVSDSESEDEYSRS